MPRTVQISIPSGQTDEALGKVGALPGIVGLALFRGASVSPPGDVLSIQATNEGTRALFGLVDTLGLTEQGSLASSDLQSLVSGKNRRLLENESNEITREEMAFFLRKETNLKASYLALMAIAGGIAAGGLLSDTLHLVVASMLIAPGFEPFVRVSFGWVGGPGRLAASGMLSIITGYLSLALGAAIVFLLLSAATPSLKSTYTELTWVHYWSTVTGTGIMVSILAGIAGTIVVMSNRSVLTTGVMIGLALIPSLALAGTALAAGDLQFCLKALLRWLVDAAIVLATSLVLLGIKQALVRSARSPD